MTADLVKSIAECRAHAADCLRKAESMREQETREDFLRLEQSWLRLARSYEFAQAAMKDAGAKRSCA